MASEEQLELVEFFDNAIFFNCIMTLSAVLELVEFFDNAIFDSLYIRGSPKLELVEFFDNAIFIPVCLPLMASWSL